MGIPFDSSIEVSLFFAKGPVDAHGRMRSVVVVFSVVGITRSKVVISAWHDRLNPSELGKHVWAFLPDLPGFSWKHR